MSKASVVFAASFVGWIIGVAIVAAMAVFVCYLWNWLAPVYFYWLPEVYHNIPFWQFIGLWFLIKCVRGLLLPNVKVKKDE